jgi:hypothetical protein
MLDDYAARFEGAVWVLEEAAAAGIIVLPPAPGYLLLDNIAVSPARQGLGWAGGCLHSQGRGRAAITKSGSTRIKRWWRISLYSAIGYQRWDAYRGRYDRKFMRNSFADDDVVDGFACTQCPVNSFHQREGCHGC